MSGTLSIGSWMRGAFAGIVFGVGVGAFGVVLFGSPAGAMLRDSEETTGHLVYKYVVRPGDRSSAPAAYRMRYRYTPPGGRHYFLEQEVAAGIWRAARLGQAVRLRYQREMPQYSVAAQRWARIRWSLWALAAAGLAAAGLGARGAVRAVRQRGTRLR